MNPIRPIRSDDRAEVLESALEHRRISSRTNSPSRWNWSTPPSAKPEQQDYLPFCARSGRADRVSLRMLRKKSP